MEEPDIDATEGQYLTAQICLSGHIANDRIEHAAENNKAFCDTCGEATITQCPNCSTPIRGYYLKHSGFRSHALFAPPAFCYSCGVAFPRTGARLKAARELAMEIDSLTDGEREALAKSLDDLVRDNPRTQLAIVRTKKALAKAGPVAKAIWDTIRPIVTDAVRAAVGPS